MFAVALIGMLAVLTMTSTLMLVYPIGPIAEYMEFVPLDQTGTQNGRMKNWFRVWLLALPLIHLAGAAAIEVIFNYFFLNSNLCPLKSVSPVLITTDTKN